MGVFACVHPTPRPADAPRSPSTAPATATRSASAEPAPSVQCGGLALADGATAQAAAEPLLGLGLLFASPEGPEQPQQPVIVLDSVWLPELTQVALEREP